MLMTSLLVVIKYGAWVGTRGKVETGAKGGVWWLGWKLGQLIGGTGLV